MKQRPLSKMPPDGITPAPTRWIIPALLIALLLAAYWPLLTAEFTLWDDYRAVVTNPWLNPPALGHLAEFWNPKNTFMEIWIPLTYTLWSVVAAIGYVPTADAETGAHLNPWLFHGTNLVVHGINVFLVFAILKRLVRRPWPAAAGAALFAIHPVQVEAVGWVAGMKDLLAGCMGLAAIWQYLLFVQPNALAEPNSVPSPLSTQFDPWKAGDGSSRRMHYTLAILAFILAMLAKPSGVVIPLILVALDVWLIRRPMKHVLISLGPWLLLAIPILLIGHRAQPAPGVEVPLPMRPFIAFDALAFYLYKLFCPIWLGITYHRSPQIVLAHHGYLFTWLAPAAAIAGVAMGRRRFPWLLPALAVFWIAVLPVLGLIPFEFQGYSTVADHYLYLAMFGPALAIAFIAGRLQATRWIAVLASLIVALAARSSIQSFTWHDSASLFANAVRVDPYSCSAYDNLAETWRSRHEYGLSAQVFESGLRNDPECVALRVGYASLLAAIDQPAAARQQFQIAAQTASGDYARLIQHSLARLAGQSPAPTTNSAPDVHLTPRSPPIK